MRAVYTGCSFVQTHIRKERGRLTCDSACVATAAGTGEHRGQNVGIRMGRHFGGVDFRNGAVPQGELQREAVEDGLWRYNTGHTHTTTLLKRNVCERA